MKLPFFIVFVAISLFFEAQVDRQILLEHFTNTRCSVCASKNPALNANLDNHPEVVRISYHPSSPYNTCIFNHLSNQLTILKLNCIASNHYEIISLNGNILIKGQLSGNVTYLNLNELASGIYLVRLYNSTQDGYTKAVKFVK